MTLQQEGYCECGCGGRTRIAKMNSAAKGWVKGRPLRYMLGHTKFGPPLRPQPRPCRACGSAFTPTSKQVRRGIGVYCSTQCSSDARRTGLRLMKHGYVMTGHKYVHVALAEAALGRPLPAKAHVHHVNGNRADNSRGNLVICQDAKYHGLLHVRARVLAAGGDPNCERICSSCKRVVRMADMVGGGVARSSKSRPSKTCLACVRAHNKQRRERVAA